MRMLLSFISFSCCCLVVAAQNVSKQDVVAANDNIKDNRPVIEWILDRPGIAPVSYEDKVNTEGLLQPILVIKVIQTVKGLSYSVEAYPNPTDDLVLIHIENAEARDFYYLFYDINGKVLEQKQLESKVTAINMKIYPAGIYLLKIMQPEKEIKTFEIVKH
ncbi:MAG: T9SS type A sorting domain-containing protein [Bacteroidales bacterium]|nr:T9SS type A sorting domain-containing protein [Bacteroidales bacterium]MBN2764272.1 T9SS type A sorting domain-containing protein [Bacteroidales bacterium]